MTRTRYTMPARSQGKLHMQRAMARHGTAHSGSDPRAHSICVQPHEDKRKPFTVGIVRVRTTPEKATLELCDRLSNPLIEVDAVVHKDLRADVVCDLGYGVAPFTVIDEGMLPIPDYHVLWPVNRRRTRCGPQWRTTRGSRRSRKRGVRRA